MDAAPFPEFKSPTEQMDHDYHFRVVNTNDRTPITMPGYLFPRTEKPTAGKFNALALVIVGVTAFIMGIAFTNFRAIRLSAELTAARSQFAAQKAETLKANAVIAQQNAQLQACSESIANYRSALETATLRAQSQADINPNAEQVLTVLRILKEVL
jgi:hypothetical protein